MKELILKGLSEYPVLSDRLKASLDKVNCPKNILRLLDRALWCELYKKPLSMEFTIYEAFILDGWVSSVKKPQDFNKALEKSLNDQLDIKFLV